MADIETIQTILDYIRENPSAWNQHEWDSCFAGLGAKLTNISYDENRLCGDRRHFSDHVADELELTSDEALLFFRSDLDLNDLDSAVLSL